MSGRFDGPFWTDPLHDEREESKAAALADTGHTPVSAVSDPAADALRYELAMTRVCPSCCAAVGELCIESQWRARMERVGHSDKVRRVEDRWVVTADRPHSDRYPPDTAERVAEFVRWRHHAWLRKYYADRGEQEPGYVTEALAA